MPFRYMLAGGAPLSATARSHGMYTQPWLTAACILCQVRRQFLERPGIMTYAEKPDYARCVSIVATSALKVGN